MMELEEECKIRNSVRGRARSTHFRIIDELIVYVCHESLAHAYICSSLMIIHRHSTHGHYIHFNLLLVVFTLKSLLKRSLSL